MFPQFFRQNTNSTSASGTSLPSHYIQGIKTKETSKQRKKKGGWLAGGVEVFLDAHNVRLEDIEGLH